MDTATTPAREEPLALVPGRLWALGGSFAIDGRVSWLPAGAQGHQATNCYVLHERGTWTIVDPGPAYHEDALLSQLERLLPRGRDVQVFLTRAELDCIGSLGAIASAYRVGRLMAGGSHNPFDAFGSAPEMDPAGRSAHLAMLRMQPGSRIALGGDRELVVLHPLMRLLNTFWAYDTGTRALFTSDLFGHLLGDDPAVARAPATAALVDPAELLEQLTAKLWWLPQANVAPLQEDLAAIFARHRVERLCPSRGRPIATPAAVEQAHRSLQDALALAARDAAAPGPAPAVVA